MPADNRSLSRRDVGRLLGLSTAVAAAAPSVMTPDLMTAVGIAVAIRKSKVSALEVLELHVKRIEASNKELNAFVYLDLDAARKTAKEIDRRIARGEDPGPLAGVPYGVKDLYDAAGMPTSRGSLLYKGRPPMGADSTHVARVRKARAVILGKTAAPEFGMSSITSSRAWGVTRNPWNPALSPAGSSGGATAAVASGMMALGSGSDAGGSIRSPAAFTGLVGLKPSHGRIGREIPSDTSAHGCLSLTVADTARFLDVAAGPTPTDRNSLPKPEASYERLIETLNVAGLRAAWSADFGFIPTERECIDVGRRAAEKLVSAAKMNWVEREFRSADPVPSWGLLAMSHLRGDPGVGRSLPLQGGSVEREIAKAVRASGLVEASRPVARRSDAQTDRRGHGEILRGCRRSVQSGDDSSLDTGGRASARNHRRP